jgi:hypothetical protein
MTHAELMKRMTTEEFAEWMGLYHAEEFLRR